MCAQPVGCCSKPVYKNDTIEVSRSDVIMLVMVIALIVISSVEAAGVFASGDFNGALGLAFRNVTNGAIIEGGIGIGLGVLVAAIVAGKIFSPRFRNICTARPTPTPSYAHVS